MSRIVMIPGLAVQSYAEPAGAALRAEGHHATVLEPPGWPGRPPELDGYGRAVAAELAAEGTPVDLLIGLSVGCQAAGVIAAGNPRIRRLLLISPTVDPQQRTRVRLLTRWLRGENHPDSPSVIAHIPDWRRAGVRRTYRGFVSVLTVHLEDLLPEAEASITIAHADHDRLSEHSYAAELARRSGGRFLMLPNAPHSWPAGDVDGFRRLTARLLDEG